ncbi:TPA: PLP-dependent transferase [Klebsiella variicola subsp. variicola]|nr:PLP-dependent transferase [Klebsiella variicola subsp. variicola]
MNNFDTLLAGLDHYTDSITGGLVPSIHTGVSSRTIMNDAAINYIRSGNPTTQLAEDILTKMEGGASAAAFNSGVSAAWALLLTLKPHDTIIVEKDCYYEFFKIMSDFCHQQQITIIFIDLSDYDALETALAGRDIEFVWAETATNPLWKIVDIARVAHLVRRYASRLIVDSTVSTPLAVQPLALGADMVLHSATKYLNGHGDLTAGFLVCKENDRWWQQILNFRTSAGLILQPMEAWLLVRGMRTLALRYGKASANAQQLANWMLKQSAVIEVFYPGITADDSSELARVQMNNLYGAMLSFRMKDGAAAARRLPKLTRVFRNSTSLGSTESLIEYRKDTEGKESSCPDDLVRLSVGIENGMDLIDDLGQAFAALRMLKIESTS